MINNSYLNSSLKTIIMGYNENFKNISSDINLNY